MKKQVESDHYSFNFESERLAEQEMDEIISHQEACFAYLCQFFTVDFPEKINYFLCQSLEEVG